MGNRKVNLNTLAKEIAAVEGKKTQVNIAQIKEVLNCYYDVLIYEYDIDRILEHMTEQFMKRMR